MRRAFNNHRLAIASFVTGFALAILMAGSNTVWGQSGSRGSSKPAPRSQAGSGSESRAQSGSATIAKESRVGLEGYCPVGIIDMKKWVRGVSAQQVKYDGKTYFFPGPEQRKMFLANPAKYVPALNGDCVVCYANMKKRVPGNVTVHGKGTANGR